MAAEANSPFGDGEPSAGWVDVRMTDPEEGEWEIDTVVVDGRVEYVDLRVRPELLASFVGCLLDDLDTASARAVLTDVAAARGIGFDADDQRDTVE